MANWKKYYLRFVGVAALNAAAFVSYRLYVHNLKNKIKPIDYENFSTKGLVAVVKLNFTSNQELLNSFKFVKHNDGVDKITIAPFEAQQVWFSLQKYQQSPKYHYNLYVDVDACQRKGIKLRDFVEQVLVGLGLSDVPTIWTPEGIALLEKETSN